MKNDDKLKDEPLTPSETWKYLAPRPSSWKKQLFIKDRRVTAANIWLDMLTNNRNVEETAENWDLPVEAVKEIILYCETNRRLINEEADAEKQRLLASGHKLEPPF